MICYSRETIERHAGLDAASTARIIVAGHRTKRAASASIDREDGIEGAEARTIATGINSDRPVAEWPIGEPDIR